MKKPSWKVIFVFCLASLLVPMSFIPRNAPKQPETLQEIKTRLESSGFACWVDSDKGGTSILVTDKSHEELSKQDVRFLLIDRSLNRPQKGMAWVEQAQPLLITSPIVKQIRPTILLRGNDESFLLAVEKAVQ